MIGNRLERTLGHWTVVVGLGERRRMQKGEIREQESKTSYFTILQRGKSTFTFIDMKFRNNIRNGYVVFVCQ